MTPRLHVCANHSLNIYNHSAIVHILLSSSAALFAGIRVTGRATGHMSVMLMNRFINLLLHHVATLLK
jgi:hypothetical protein